MIQIIPCLDSMKKTKKRKRIIIRMNLDKTKKKRVLLLHNTINEKGRKERHRSEQRLQQLIIIAFNGLLKSGKNGMDGKESKKINDIAKKKFDEEEDDMKDEENPIQYQRQRGGGE
eukprot:CAMPEP_0194161772 /NCGR_PEP_ID=MMETSP0152-20130528/79118_1 /TAXON_ID=1049557 /ORGANISM="Thalassiothrix antarctica, Strain L6-D1" /LENGTH=115 /DNA_ID=CAMNT_0038871587 /DNA_START=207 /DNA_END=558 /DNA_ORIENTATION=+